MDRNTTIRYLPDDFPKCADVCVALSSHLELRYGALDDFMHFEVLDAWLPFFAKQIFARVYPPLAR